MQARTEGGLGTWQAGFALGAVVLWPQWSHFSDVNGPFHFF